VEASQVRDVLDVLSGDRGHAAMVALWQHGRR
jgi:hypothetical protein